MAPSSAARVRASGRLPDRLGSAVYVRSRGLFSGNRALRPTDETVRAKYEQIRSIATNL
ncbi:hypothetical protein ACFRAQ_27605 [Nocardia sp. NPDC056611]|uniref:hypothetical protein n=1 Tax=Nocardia sp. NPDC056611 TaxID=3345877 RepID=UPI00366C7CFC